MIAFDTATPTAMIAPMNDSMFKVVFVTQSASTTPARTLEVGGQHDQDHDHGHGQADLQAPEHLLHRPDLAPKLDLGPLGGLAGPDDRGVDPVDHTPEVLPLHVGRQAEVTPHVVAVD